MDAAERTDEHTNKQQKRRPSGDSWPMSITFESSIPAGEHNYKLGVHQFCQTHQ